jgi:hypothetical protein
VIPWFETGDVGPDLFDDASAFMAAYQWKDVGYVHSRGTKHVGHLRRRHAVSSGEMVVGMADASRHDPNEDFVVPRFVEVDLANLPRFPYAP